LAGVDISAGWSSDLGVVMNAFVHEARRSMTPHRRAKIFADREGRCHKCKRTLGPSDDWDCDHVLALENGGTDDDNNLAPCCSWCHVEKTADDHETAGHGRRAAVRHTVPKRFRKGKGWK
jgi:5-methylcytosine-specific restriction enzyme A